MGGRRFQSIVCAASAAPSQRAQVDSDSESRMMRAPLPALESALSVLLKMHVNLTAFPGQVTVLSRADFFLFLSGSIHAGSCSLQAVWPRGGCRGSCRVSCGARLERRWKQDCVPRLICRCGNERRPLHFSKFLNVVVFALL